MRILLTGATGQLGSKILDRLAARDHEVIGWCQTPPSSPGCLEIECVDLLDFDRLEPALIAANPDVIIHTAAVSSADAVRRDPGRAYRINVAATERLVAWAARGHGKRLLYTSTDLVFDGTQSWCNEHTPPNPILEYGRTKLAAEPSVLSFPGGLVARLSLLYGFGRPDRPGFFDKAIENMRRGQPQSYFTDEHRTPLDYASAAEILIRLAESSITGLIHVAGTERMSRFELMRRAATALGIDPRLVQPNQRMDVRLAEPRPEDVSLDTRLLHNLLPEMALPSIEQVLSR